MTILDEIKAKCSAELIASRDHDAIAAAVSVGRVKSNKTEIGNGTILEVLGLTAGTQLLDAIYATPALKYVVPLLEQGRLQIGSTVAQQGLQAFVGYAVTQDDADKLKTLGFDADPITEFDVRCNLYLPDGTFLG